MANQLREWIQGVVTAVGQKAGYTGTMNASDVIQNIENLPDTEELKNTIKGFIEGGMNELVIPTGISSVKANFLTGDTTIEKVTFSNSVETIGDNAFKNCSNLVSVEFAENGSLTTFGNNVFDNCDKLTSIVLPEGLTDMGTYTFSNILTIDSVTFPSTLTKIGNYAFYKCWRVNFTTLPETITEIGDYAFADITSFSTFTIPNSVTKLGQYCFSISSSGGLSYVVVPESITEIPNGCFSGARLINGILFLAKATKIGDNAFKGAGNSNTIYNFKLPNTLQQIGEHAFNNCKLWSASEIIEIPDSVTTIGNSAFQLVNCYSVKLPENNDFTTLPNYMLSSSKIVELTLPDNVTRINQQALQNCSKLKKINLNKVSVIGQQAIEASTLPSITIPNTVTNIGMVGISGKSGYVVVIESTTPFTLGMNGFGTVGQASRIYIKNGDLNTFKSASNWSTYGDYMFAPNTITFNIDSLLLNNENVLYSIDNGEDQQFTQTSFTGENLATLRVTSKTADIVVKVGTTQGGSEIGTVANASTTFTFESDTTIYITKQ